MTTFICVFCRTLLCFPQNNTNECLEIFIIQREKYGCKWKGVCLAESNADFEGYHSKCLNKGIAKKLQGNFDDSDAAE